VNLIVLLLYAIATWLLLGDVNYFKSIKFSTANHNVPLADLNNRTSTKWNINTLFNYLKIVLCHLLGWSKG